VTVSSSNHVFNAEPRRKKVMKAIDVFQGSGKKHLQSACILLGHVDRDITMAVAEPGLP
jgi:hypothetical protein